MNKEHMKQIKDTFFNQKKEAINMFWDKAVTFVTGNKWISRWGHLWAWYYITFLFIAPVLKSLFMIATWTNLLIFYWMVIFIGFIISQIFNTIIKLLLYLFKS